MKTRILLLLLVATCKILPAQCPTMLAAMIDACNDGTNEGYNEFFLFRNGSTDIPLSSITINYGSNNPASSSPNATFTPAKNTGVYSSGTYTTQMTAYIHNLVNAAANSGAYNIINTADFTTVPANATVVVFNPLAVTVYDLSGLQNLKPLYVVFSTGFIAGGTFKNDGTSTSNNFRYFSIQTNATGGSCAESLVGYDYTLLGPTTTPRDGDFANWSSGSALAPTYINQGSTCGGSTMMIALPVNLTSFKASKTNPTILEWQVENEVQIAKYVIERSTGGVNYTSIGEQVAKSYKTYSFTDRNEMQGQKYYRLAITGTDGTRDYSQVLSVNLSHSKKDYLTVRPLPAKSFTIVDWHADKDETVEIQFLDVSGQLVKKLISVAAKGNNRKQIAVNDLPKGHYTIILRSNQQMMSTKFLIID